VTVRLVERVFPQWLWRLPAGCKAVAVTFDDGPLPATTPLLLAALNRLQIPATHFLLGSHCAENPALVRELHAAGQTVGSHAFDHTSLFFRSAAFQRGSLRRTEDVLLKVLPEPSRLFRPPYGRFNMATMRLVRHMNYVGVLWSLSARDWDERAADLLWKRLERGLHEGAIILLHDGHPSAPAVVRLLPRLADEVARRGWSFVPLNRTEIFNGNRVCS
jgi:peptidoglycan/xylan/chitin deacetylase (PgdA/CDA1 family)